LVSTTLLSGVTVTIGAVTIPAIAAALVAVGGAVGVAGIRNPGKAVRAEDCAGGQLVGASAEVARQPLSNTPPLAQPTGSRA
jgi:hypothetical protein